MHVTIIDKKGVIIIEVQYLCTLKDLTFDNIYHEHYNYWSLTSLKNFFDQFDANMFKSEKIDTHGGSWVYICKDNRKITPSVKKCLRMRKNLELIQSLRRFGKKFIKLEKIF